MLYGTGDINHIGLVRRRMSLAKEDTFELLGSGDPVFLYFQRILANFFMFMHAKVSPTFMAIFSLPICWVYRIPWCSLAVPKSRSMVSFLLPYSSFIPALWRISSQISRCSCQICRVTVFWWFLFWVHCSRCGHLLHICGSLLYSRYPSRLVVEYFSIWPFGQR